jgi:hypothetical protein
MVNVSVRARFHVTFYGFYGHFMTIVAMLNPPDLLFCQLLLWKTSYGHCLHSSLVEQGRWIEYDLVHTVLGLVGQVQGLGILKW